MCTSQYFVWYLCLLPLVVDRLRPSNESLVTFWTHNAAAWFGEFTQLHFKTFQLAGGQAVWLAFAYLLEFHGVNTFVCIWLASIAFLLINCTLIVRLMRAYADYCNQGAAVAKQETTRKSHNKAK